MNHWTELRARQHGWAAMSNQPFYGSGPGGQLQAALTFVSTLVWIIYRNFLQGVISYVVPPHIMHALFQLLCDLRANTPKDQRFVVRHARALAPRTFSGWIACASCACLLGAVAAAAACAALALGLMGMCVAGAAAFAAGTVLAVAGAGAMALLLCASLACSCLGLAGCWTYALSAAALALLRAAARLLRPPSPAPRREDGASAPHRAARVEVARQAARAEVAQEAPRAEVVQEAPRAEVAQEADAVGSAASEASIATSDDLGERRLPDEVALPSPAALAVRQALCVEGARAAGAAPQPDSPPALDGRGAGKALPAEPPARLSPGAQPPTPPTADAPSGRARGGEGETLQGAAADWQAPVASVATLPLMSVQT